MSSLPRRAGAWRLARRCGLAVVLGALLLGGIPARAAVLLPRQAAAGCVGAYQPVSPALTDLGSSGYVRLDGTITAFAGGLYPGGHNQPPAGHLAGGKALAQEITPLGADGKPSPDGRIVLLAIGMSNTAMEFRAFRDRLKLEPAVNPRLSAVSGAAAGQVAQYWLAADAPNWGHVADRLRHEHLTPLQVQAAWVKLTRTGGGKFPDQARGLQSDLAVVVHHLHTHYPNLKLVYLSSRTRGYTYWYGLSPEPLAFETGFSVKWLIEAQIAGDPDLNYDPARGPVAAPWLAWGPYLWADGVNPRSDGLTWTLDDVERDCTHPSDSGVAKVVDMLLRFFQTDPTTRSWFLAPGAEPATAVPTASQPPRPTEASVPVERDDSPAVICLLRRSVCAR